MECKFDYLKHDVEYVLCKKEPTPDRANRAALFHAICGHQAHCPKENCHKLTASWPNCIKLAEKPQEAAGDAFAEIIPAQEEAPKKRTRKATAAKSEE